MVEWLTHTSERGLPQNDMAVKQGSKVYEREEAITMADLEMFKVV